MTMTSNSSGSRREKKCLFTVRLTVRVDPAPPLKNPEQCVIVICFAKEFCIGTLFVWVEDGRGFAETGIVPPNRILTPPAPSGMGGSLPPIRPPCIPPTGDTLGSEVLDALTTHACITKMGLTFIFLRYCPAGRIFENIFVWKDGLVKCRSLTCTQSRLQRGTAPYIPDESSPGLAF